MRRAGILLLVAGLLVSPFLAALSSGQTVPSELPWSNYAQDYLSDRHLDPTFGTGGKLMTGLRANGTAGIALQKDGRIIVATHNLYPNGGSLLMRLLPTGAYDPTFGEGGRTSTIIPRGGEFEVPDIQSVVLQEDGKIVVAGMAVRYSNITPISPPNFYLTRFNSNGLPDESFGEGGSLIWSLQKYHYGLAVAVQTDGKILFAGGSDNQANNNRRFALYRFSPAGEMEADFGSASASFNATAPAGFALDALIQPDGKIVLTAGRSFQGGAVSNQTNFILARYNSDGSADDGGAQDSTPGDGFGSSGIVETDFGRPREQAFSLALQPTPGGLKLLAAGCSSTSQCLFRTGFVDNERRVAEGQAPGGDWGTQEGKVAMARYNLGDGSLDPLFSPGDEAGKSDEMDGGASSMSVHADGTIAITTKRTASPYIQSFDFEVARFLADGAPDLAFGVGGVVTTREFTAATAPWGPGVPNPNYQNMSQRVVIQPDGRILVGGESNGGGFQGHEVVMARYVSSPTLGIPDLGISISGSPDPVTRGDNLQYRIQIENRAATPALGVGLRQIIPQGLSVVSTSSDQGGCTVAGNEVSCGFGSMLPGAKATVTVTALVGAVNGTVITSTAEVASGTYRNSATAETTVGRPAGEWTLTRSMAQARSAHTATVLSGPGCGGLCGKVLVAGGRTAAGALSSAEIYDPAADSWSPTAAMSTGRFGHTATLLASGKVMVAGGATTTQQAITSVEIYDPALGTWTQAVPMLKPRYGHTATLLDNGKVLIAGGQGTPNSLADSELYSPGLLSVDPNAPGLTRTGATEAAGSLNQGRSFFTATLLPGGKVLAVGGFRGPRFEVDDANDPGDSGGPYGKAEIFDPGGRQWTDAGNNAVGRWSHTATALKDGRVLVAGGNVTTGGGIPTDSVEIYNPSNGKWAPAPTMVVSRFSHTAVLLPDGKVLVAGGRAREPAGQAIRTAELFDPSTGGWQATDIMHFARYDHPLVNITGTPEQCGPRCGKVLAAGGTGERTTPAGGEPQATAEYYSPSQPHTQGEPPPGPGDDPVGKKSAEDQGVNQPASTRQDQLAAPPPPAPPASPPGAPATLGSGSPLSVTNPVPGSLGATSLTQSAAASAASGLIYRQQPSSAQPAAPEAEGSRQHDAAERFAMVMLGQSTFRVWFAIAITAVLGCIIASARATAAALCMDPRPAWAPAAAGPVSHPRD